MKLQYHIRVVVPCLEEELDIVQKTVLAALDADLPAGCGRTVYLCDDGQDPEKRDWAHVRGLLPILHWAEPGDSSLMHARFPAALRASSELPRPLAARLWAC